MAATAPFRLLRSSIIASTSLCLASAAHTAAGGTLPEPLIFTAMIALTLLASTVVSRWKLGPVSILGILALSQLSLHQCFEWFAFSPMTGASSTPHQHQHGSALAELPAMLPAHSAHSADSAGLGMLLAHVIATIIVGLMVARGESVLWALGDWLRPLLRLLMPAVLPVPRQPAAASAPTERAKPQRFLRAARWRGPPPTGLSLIF